MNTAPAWALEVVADLDPRVIAPPVVARLLACEAAWSAFPSDAARLEVLAGLIYFDALFGFDPDFAIPTPARAIERVKFAAAHMRTAAAALAQVPDGTLWRVGVAAGVMPHMLRAQAEKLEANAGLSPVRSTARHDTLLPYLSDHVELHAERPLRKVTAALASAFLDETITVAAVTTAISRLRNANANKARTKRPPSKLTKTRANR